MPPGKWVTRVFWTKYYVKYMYVLFRYVCIVHFYLKTNVFSKRVDKCVHIGPIAKHENLVRQMRSMLSNWNNLCGTYITSLPLPLLRSHQYKTYIFTLKNNVFFYTHFILHEYWKSTYIRRYKMIIEKTGAPHNPTIPDRHIGDTAL